MCERSNIPYYLSLAQVIQLCNQKATTSTIFDNFFIHYGFPGKLHSDQRDNFESKVIKRHCNQKAL